MPTKPGSCGLPYYGIEFAVLDPVVSIIDALITALPYHAHEISCGDYYQVLDPFIDETYS